MGRERKRRRIDVPDVPANVGGAAFGESTRVSERLRSRVLYANPVCLLCTRGRDGRANVMTISWLTCINNFGVFFMSMNEQRASAANVYDAAKGGYYPGAKFTLNVPVQGAENLLRRIGGESGRDVDKIGTLGLKVTSPGAFGEGRPYRHPERPAAAEEPATPDATMRGDDEEAAVAPAQAPGCAAKRARPSGDGVEDAAGDGAHHEPEPFALDHPLVVAHVACRILEGRVAHKHHLLICEIDDAFVRSKYWAGDTFRPTTPGLPSYLTFFGASIFGGAPPLLPGFMPEDSPRGSGSGAPADDAAKAAARASQEAKDAPTLPQ